MVNSEDNINIKINKISLFINIFLAIIAALSLFSSTMFEYFYQGQIEEVYLPPKYPEKHQNQKYYVHIFRYKHIKGNPVQDSSFEFRVMNTGSDIDDYEPFFKTLFSKNSIENIKDKKFVKLDIPLIRPNDEFDVALYTKNNADIRSIVVMKNGRLVNMDGKIWLKSTSIWISLLLGGFFSLLIVYYKRTLKILEDEKIRIIGERNALQQIILSGQRLSVNKRKK